MCVMILNYLDKNSMYIGLYKTPNKVLSLCCLVLSCLQSVKLPAKKKRKKKNKQTKWKFPHLFFSGKTCREKVFVGELERKLSFLEYENID